MKSTCLDTGMPLLIMDGGRSGIRHRAVWITATRPSLDRSSFFSSLPLSSDTCALSPGQQRHQSAMTLTTATSSSGRGHTCRSQFLEFGGQSPALAATANTELVTGRRGFLCGPQSQPVHVLSDGGSSPSSLSRFKGQVGATAFNCDAANPEGEDKLKITVNVHLPKWMRSKFPPNSHGGGCGVKTSEPVYGECQGNDGLNPAEIPSPTDASGQPLMQDSKMSNPLMQDSNVSNQLAQDSNVSNQLTQESKVSPVMEEASQHNLPTATNGHQEVDHNNGVEHRQI